MSGNDRKWSGKTRKGDTRRGQDRKGDKRTEGENGNRKGEERRRDEDRTQDRRGDKRTEKKRGTGKERREKRWREEELAKLPLHSSQVKCTFQERLPSEKRLRTV